MTRVFLSHAHQDGAVARQLAEKLSKTGFEGWLDEPALGFGHESGDVMKVAIRNAGAVLVLVSERSLKNPWVQFEIGAAFGMGKRVIPVLIGEGGPGEEIPGVLRGLQYIDARDRSLDDIGEELAHFLSSTPKSELLKLEVSDRPGTLGKIATTLARAECNVLRMEARRAGPRVFVDMSIEAPEPDILAKVKEDLLELFDVIRIE